VKQEQQFDIISERRRHRRRRNSNSPAPIPDSVIELSDSDSDVDLDSVVANATAESPSKKRKVNDKGGAILPAGFLSPLAPSPSPASTPVNNGVLSLPAPEWASTSNRLNKSVSFSLMGCKQFWKAGDYVGSPARAFESSTGNFFFPSRVFDVVYVFFIFFLCCFVALLNLVLCFVVFLNEFYHIAFSLGNNNFRRFSFTLTQPNRSTSCMLVLILGRLLRKEILYGSFMALFQNASYLKLF